MEQLVTKRHMIEILKTIKGATPISLEYFSQVKMNKTNNPYFEQVYKHMVANVFINFNYTNSVNKARTKEGVETGFQAKPRRWGTHLPGTPLIEHNGSFYLECRFLDNTVVKYIFEEDEIDPSVIAPYLPTKNENTMKAHQGLEEVIQLRDIALKNIYKITMKKVTYLING